MKFTEIKRAVDGIPYILPECAKDIYHFIVTEQPRQCLELGFAHGASSCYIAAALDELGHGRLTSVDLLAEQQWQHPSIEELLEQTGLANLVEVVRETTSYTWFLKKMIERQSTGNRCRPVYDFCFIDGAKNWTIDGLTFFLVDKLLKPGGWILFDDLQWTYVSKLQEGKTKTDGISMRNMSAEELNQPHIELIFQLLVMQHPGYANFKVKDNWWAWAQKGPGSRDVSFDYSQAYLARLARWEAEHGRKQRPPFQPFPGEGSD